MGAYKDGKQWRWRRQIRMPNGKRKRLSGTPEINTKAAALADEHDAIEDALAGRRTKKAAPTMQAIADEYLAHVRIHRSPALADNRVSQIRTHLLPVFGRTRLDCVTVQMIDRYKASKVADGLEPGTINQHLLGLSNVLRWSKERGLIEDMPKIVKLPVRDKSTEDLEYLEPAELDTAIAKAGGEMRTMVIVAAHTGLRAGELLALRWVDVNFDASRIIVRRSLYRGQDRPPKGKRSRTIPLSQAVQDALMRQRHTRGPLVFCDDDGAAWPYWLSLERLKETGVEGWHVLRHTFGTTLATRGVPLRAIQEWMGHADIKTTMVYAHFSPVLESAISVLDTGKTWQGGGKVGAKPSKSGGDSNA